MRNVLKKLSSILEALTIISFLAIFTLVVIQMSGRFLSISIGWTDEMISCFTTWMSMLGASCLAYKKGHVKIDMLVKQTEGILKEIILLLVELLNLLCGIAFIYSGWLWVMSSVGKKTANLQIDYNLWYISFMLLGIMYTLFCLVHIFEILSDCLRRTAEK